jgi:hypothetical protein
MEQDIWELESPGKLSSIKSGRSSALLVGVWITSSLLFICLSACYFSCSSSELVI